MCIYCVLTLSQKQVQVSQTFLLPLHHGGQIYIIVEKLGGCVIFFRWGEIQFLAETRTADNIYLNIPRRLLWKNTVCGTLRMIVDDTYLDLA